MTPSPDLVLHRKGLTMRNITRPLAAIAVLSLLILPGASASDGAASYQPPFAEPIEEADRWTISDSDAGSGWLFMGRGNPIPGVTNCVAGNAQIHYEIEHEVTTPFSEVTATFEDAVVDGYTWVEVAVRDAEGQWLAQETDRGPTVLSGTVTASLFDNLPAALLPEVGDTVTIRFGLQLASACANVNGGTARFTEITVS